MRKDVGRNALKKTAKKIRRCPTEHIVMLIVPFLTAQFFASVYFVFFVMREMRVPPSQGLLIVFLASNGLAMSIGLLTTAVGIKWDKNRH